MRPQKQGTVSWVVLRLIAGGLLGGAVTIVAWIIVGLLYGLVTGLTENRLGISVEGKMLQGAINGVFFAPLGALSGAAFILLRFFWLNTNNKKRWIRACVIVATVTLTLWSIMYFKGERDKVAIRMRYLEFCSSILEDRYQDAYPFMSPSYRQTHTIREFQKDPKLQNDVFVGIRIIGCDLDDESSIGIFGNRATVYPEPSPLFDWYVGPSYDWRRIEGEWYFTGGSEWSVD